MGFYTLSDKKYILPEDTEYALIDFNDGFTFRGFYHQGGYVNLQSVFLKYNWELIEMVDSLVMFRKSSNGGDFICSKVEPKHYNLKKEIIRVGDSFALVDSHFACLPNQEAIEVILYWKSIRETEKDVQMLISITDSQGMVIRRLMHPICYRIFPTQSWKRGEVYRDVLRIHIPDEYLKVGVIFTVEFYDHSESSIIKLGMDGKSYDFASIGGLRCVK
jgi:hypothetical protein